MLATTQVSEISIVPVKPRDGLVAFASFVVDRKLYVGSVAVFTRLDGRGIRLVYPSKNQIQCVHPISKEVGEIINEAVEKKFNLIFTHQFTEKVYEQRPASQMS